MAVETNQVSHKVFLELTAQETSSRVPVRIWSSGYSSTFNRSISRLVREASEHSRNRTAISNSLAKLEIDPRFTHLDRAHKSKDQDSEDQHERTTRI